MFETTRTHARWRRRRAGRGILLISGLTILKPPALMMYIFFDNVYSMINIMKSASLRKQGLYVTFPRIMSPCYLQHDHLGASYSNIGVFTKEDVTCYLLSIALVFP